VRVTTVSPGFVRTEMTENNEFPMPFIIDADEAARAIADGLERRRTEIVFPLPMAVTMKLARLVPVRVWGALTSRAGNPASDR
jgi:short-subunit dehydrogenase